MISRQRAFVATALALALAYYRVWNSHQGLPGIPGFDLHVYWNGARDFLHGRDPWLRGHFVTPPTGLLIIAPLGWFKLTTAYWIVQVLSVVFFAFGGCKLLQLAGASGWWVVPLSIALTVVLPTSFLTIFLGSLNSWIFMCTALALWYAEQRRDLAAGVWLGLGIALKPVLIPLVVVFLLQRRWRAAASAIGVPIVLGLLGYGLGNGMRTFIHQTIPRIRKGSALFSSKADFSLQNVLGELHVHHGGLTIARVIVVLIAVGSAFYVWRTTQPIASLSLETSRLISLGMLFTTALFLVSSMSWSYYSVFLLPALLLLRSRINEIARWTIVAGLTTMLMPDMLNPTQAAFGTFRSSVREGIGAMVLLLGLAAISLGNPSTDDG